MTAAAAEEGRLGDDKIRLLCDTCTPDVAAAFKDREDILVRTVEGLSVDGARHYLKTWQISAQADAAARGRPTGDPTGDPPGNDPAGPDGDGDGAEAGGGGGSGVGDGFDVGEGNRLHLSQTFGGRFVHDGEFDPVNGAIMAQAIAAVIDSWHHAGMLDGDTRSRSQLQADALVELVTRGAGRLDQHGDLRPLVLGVIDIDTLCGRMPTDSQAVMRFRSEIHGAGPVNPETIRRLLCEGDIARVVVNGHGQPLDVGRKQRLFTPAMWRAMIVASGGTCEFPGCDAPHQWCQAHHIRPWEHDGHTSIENGAVLCKRHHTAVHEGGYIMTRQPDGIHVTKPDGTPLNPTYKHRAA